MMQQRQVVKFKTVWGWLKAHSLEYQMLGLKDGPHRNTLWRRCQPSSSFWVTIASEMDERVEGQDLYGDKSLFIACSPVWHQADRAANRVLPRLRALDTDASWPKSGCHGGVYGYSIHITCNGAGFPKLAQAATGTYHTLT